MWKNQPFQNKVSLSGGFGVET